MYHHKNNKILCIVALKDFFSEKSDLLFVYQNLIIFLQNNFKQNDLNLSCAKDFRNLISMVTWCII